MRANASPPISDPRRVEQGSRAALREGSCPLCGHFLDNAQGPCGGCQVHRACGEICCPRCSYRLAGQGGSAGLLARVACALRHRLAGRAIPALMASTALIALAAAGSSAGPSRAPERASRSRYLMGTVCEGVAYASGAASALDAAFDEIARLEEVLSDYRPESELSRVNRSAGSRPFSCSRDLYDFIKTAVGFSRDTGGAFDITIAPLVQVWDLRGSGRLAGDREVEEALSHVGSSRIALDDAVRTVRFGVRGMALDPGGLGKGYALDAAARVLHSRGVTSALLDFGGQILAIGAPPGDSAWEVDVAHPLKRHEAALRLRVRDASVSTSGNAERGMEVAGRILGHIVDPRSGRPVSSLGSASAIAPTGSQADAASTALFVMGPDAGLKWAEAMPLLSALYLEPAGEGQLTMRASRNLTDMVAIVAGRTGARSEGGR